MTLMYKMQEIEMSKKRQINDIGVHNVRYKNIQKRHMTLKYKMQEIEMFKNDR